MPPEAKSWHWSARSNKITRKKGHGLSRGLLLNTSARKVEIALSEPSALKPRYDLFAEDIVFRMASHKQSSSVNSLGKLWCAIAAMATNYRRARGHFRFLRRGYTMGPSGIRRVLGKLAVA